MRRNNFSYSKLFLFGILVLISITSLLLAGSALHNKEVPIFEGENILSFNISSHFYVKTLVELNPNIEVVSYRDINETKGYANVFGGVGKNFYIENNTMYEIYSSKNTTLILP